MDTSQADPIVAETIDQPTARMSRRRFAALTAGTLGAIAAGFTTFAVLDDDSDQGAAIRTFDVAYPEDVYVTMTNGEKFVVTVKEVGTGKVLEEHTGVTAKSLAGLRSDWLEILPTA